MTKRQARMRPGLIRLPQRVSKNISAISVAEDCPRPRYAGPLRVSAAVDDPASPTLGVIGSPGVLQPGGAGRLTVASSGRGGRNASRRGERVSGSMHHRGRLPRGRAAGAWLAPTPPRARQKLATVSGETGRGTEGRGA